ncbi:MAG TPA: hypothetical protein VLB50_07355 [Ignavibacteriaceae bacterium]|nr:hypothetical protein [Ignavibacteriaceae bacterium]
MTSLKSPGTSKFPDSSLEKQVYNVVDELKNYLPIMNDRNRLGFCLFKFMKGEGDSPEIILKTNKLTIEGITHEELTSKINSGLEKIRK